MEPQVIKTVNGSLAVEMRFCACPRVTQQSWPRSKLETPRSCSPLLDAFAKRFVSCARPRSYKVALHSSCLSIF